MRQTVIELSTCMRIALAPDIRVDHRGLITVERIAHQQGWCSIRDLFTGLIQHPVAGVIQSNYRRIGGELDQCITAETEDR